MSASFSKTISAASLSDNNSAELGWLHALLTYAAANNSGGDVITGNAVSEAIRRFEAAGLNPHAVRRAKELLARAELDIAKA